jgi:hypothetical protein
MTSPAGANRHSHRLSPIVYRLSSIGYLLSAICLLLLACQRPHPVGSLIQGLAYRESFSDAADAFYQVFLVYDVDGLPRIPLVKVNDVPIEMTDFQPQQGQYESWDVFPVDTTMDVKIANYDGEAHCRVNMPGNTALTRPTPWFVLQKGQPVAIAWNKAHGASTYYLDLYINYEYNDTFGEWDDFENEWDTTITDTSFTFPASWVFPPIVGEVLDGEGYIILWAQDGPPLLAGDWGNIKGHGFGYFATAFEPPDGWFPIVTPPATRLGAKQVSARNRMRVMQRMRRAAGIPDTLPLPGITKP